MHAQGPQAGDAGVLYGMALTRKDAEADLRGLRRPLNEHILKLTAFDMPDERRTYFRKEIRKWLRDIQVIRFKDNNRPGKADWYFELLYEGPFGGVEERNVALICEGIEDYYESSLARNTASIPELVERLRAFHTELAGRAARGEILTEMAATL